MQRDTRIIIREKNPIGKLPESDSLPWGFMYDGAGSSPEFFRGHPYILFKYGGEVSRVIESHLFRNLVSQYGSVREKFLCPLDPFQVDEIRYGMLRSPF